jgi:ABC-type bacteriocin/lantibiotic exporter with double-glycine peptidase domain
MAERKGLHAEGWRLTFSDFVNSTFPLLLFVRNDHFVVADSVRDHIVFLRDPSIGKVIIPAMELTRIWHGEALVFNVK